MLLVLVGVYLWGVRALFSIHMVRILLFFVAMPFHAFIGTMFMGSKTLVSEA